MQLTHQLTIIACFLIFADGVQSACTGTLKGTGKQVGPPPYGCWLDSKAPSLPTVSCFLMVWVLASPPFCVGPTHAAAGSASVVPSLLVLAAPPV